MKKNYARRNANEYHIFRTIFYKVFVITCVRLYVNFMYKFKVLGLENVPKSPHVIYAPNHVSELDPPFVSLAVNKTIAYMAKKELFEDDTRSWLIKRLGAFAVNREKPELSTFKTVGEIFKTSWSLGIFPQGGTKKNKKIEDIHKGFVLFAKKAKADIVPVSIVNFDGYSKSFRSKELTIVVGKPISYKLPSDEIVQLWCKEICKNTGYENCMLKESEEPQQD